MIVNLAVEHQHEPPGWGQHRLMAGGRQIENREAAMGQTDSGVGANPNAAVIRAAMSNRRRHRVQRCCGAFGGEAAGLPETSQSTHYIAFPHSLLVEITESETVETGVDSPILYGETWLYITSICECQAFP